MNGSSSDQRGKIPSVRCLLLLATSQRRGAETFSFQLGRALEARGLEVTVAAVEPARHTDPLPIEVLGDRRWSVSGFGRLVARARGVDVVVGCGSSALISGSAAAALARRPFVYRSIGDPAVWGAVAGAQVRIGRPLRSANAVIGLYPGAADTLRRRYGVTEAALTVIPSAAPADQFPLPTSEQRRQARADLGLDPRLSWIADVGALSEEKLPEVAIETIALRPDLGLVVAGDGPMRAEIEALAEQRCPGRVRFLGVLNPVRPVFWAAEAILLTSRTEGIPGVLAEAAFSGLPAVATNVGGVCYVVEDGITGRLVPVRDPEGTAAALDQVLANRDEMGRAAREHCLANFTLDRVADQFEELLLRVAGEGRRPGG